MVGICLKSNAVVILNFHQKLYAEAQLWSRFFFLFGIKRVGLALMAACSPQSAFHIFFFSPRSRVSSFIAGGHSITTWTKIYPILTSYPSQVPIVNILHAAYPLFTWPNVDFLLTTYLPFCVNIVIEWPPCADLEHTSFHIVAFKIS